MQEHYPGNNDCQMQEQPEGHVICGYEFSSLFPLEASQVLFFYYHNWSGKVHCLKGQMQPSQV